MTNFVNNSGESSQNVSIDDPQSNFDDLWKYIFILVLLSLITLTISGNLLVLESFKINKKLRTITNYFLISLACADLMIGIVSMPIATLYFLNDKWLLGKLVCDLWLSLDYTLSNASVANLLLISFDRYLTLTRPIVYRAQRTGLRVRLAIAFSWLMSAILWTPFILYFNSHTSKTNETIKGTGDSLCRIEFLYTNRYVTIGTALAAFYLPVTIICIVYYKIWMVTRKRHTALLKNIQLKTKNTRNMLSVGNRINTSCSAFNLKSSSMNENGKKINNLNCFFFSIFWL
jgi:muscarinic acetylcholine receptor M3